MNFFLRSVSYIFHPILMPLLGALLYFAYAPRFIPNDVIIVKVFGLIVITVLIPIVLFFFLKNLKVITSIELPEVEQRKIPLLLLSIILLVVIKMIIEPQQYPELYFFFLGCLFSTLSATFMVLFGVKASIHMIGSAGVTMFIIALSIHFGINLTLVIAIAMICNGLLATSRLHFEAHTNTELILGFFIGLIPQIILVNFWL